MVVTPPREMGFISIIMKSPQRTKSSTIALTIRWRCGGEFLGDRSYQSIQFLIRTKKSIRRSHIFSNIYGLSQAKLESLCLYIYVNDLCFPTGTIFTTLNTFPESQITLKKDENNWERMPEKKLRPCLSRHKWGCQAVGHFLVQII